MCSSLSGDSEARALGSEEGRADAGGQGESGHSACEARKALEGTLHFIQNVRSSHCGVKGRQVTP